jgi:hypothetical protein
MAEICLLVELCVGQSERVDDINDSLRSVLDALIAALFG